MATKVLLWQTVDKLGRRGDEVTVADGFARNYLFPRKLATPSTKGAAREFKAAARKAEKHEAAIKREYSDLAARVGQAHATVEMLANHEGVLFGSVTPSMVAEALKRAGLEVNAKFILIEAAIKNLGDYVLTVRFHPEVQAKLKLTVLPSKAEAAIEETDEENPFAKGISVDEAEKHDPRLRGKRPKKGGGERGRKEMGEKKGEGEAKGGEKAEDAKAEAPKGEEKAAKEKKKKE